MSNLEEKTQETEVSRQDGKKVVRQSTATSSTQATRLTLANAIWYVAGFIEILLGFRLALKLFGANPNSAFVDFIYSITNVLIAPFESIFSSPTTEGDVVTSVFESATVVALIVYSLIAWSLVKLVNLNQRQT